MTKPVLVDDLEMLAQRRQAEVDLVAGRVIPRTIGFVDLSGSTRMKLEGGHLFGTRASLTQNRIVRDVTNRFGGLCVKELGDGVLLEFENPLDACLAMLNAREALGAVQSISKFALSSGAVEELMIGGQRDVIGATVDRCARLASMAAPNQILIDRAVHDAVESFLLDFAGVEVSRAMQVSFKGLGETEVFELTTSGHGFVRAPALDGLDPVSQLVREITGFARLHQSRWILSSKLYQQPNPLITGDTKRLDIMVGGGKSMFHDRALCAHLRDVGLAAGQALRPRVLFVHPDAYTIKSRANYIRVPTSEYQAYIRDCVSMSCENLEQLRKAGLEIEWRFFDNCPLAFRFIIADDKLFLSYYTKGDRETSEVLEFSPPVDEGTSIFAAFENLFGVVWDEASEEL